MCARAAGWGGAGIGHLFSQGKSEVGVFSQITGTRSLYRSRTRADSAMRCSKECSRLCAKLIRILDGKDQTKCGSACNSSIGAIPAKGPACSSLVLSQPHVTRVLSAG